MNTNDLNLFVRTADSSSITRAAEQLDITTAAASAALKRLEKQLGVQLFVRSTRQLRITAEGEQFLAYCREALGNLEAGRASLHALQGRVAGELRISAPSDLGRNILMGWLDDIMEQHQDVSIHLMLGDSRADFYLDRVDLAIRYGKPEDSSMVAFKLATTDRILCASPTYLAKKGMPQTLEELQKHNCLLYQLNNRLYDQWELESSHDNEIHKIRVSSNRCSNDADVVHRWAVTGKGVAYKSRLDMTEDLRAGRVIRVLPEYQSASMDLNLICPSRKQVTPAVLLLRDILRDKLSQY